MFNLYFDLSLYFSKLSSELGQATPPLGRHYHETLALPRFISQAWLPGHPTLRSCSAVVSCGLRYHSVVLPRLPQSLMSYLAVRVNKQKFIFVLFKTITQPLNALRKTYPPYHPPRSGKMAKFPLQTVPLTFPSTVGRKTDMFCRLYLRNILAPPLTESPFSNAGRLSHKSSCTAGD